MEGVHQTASMYHFSRFKECYKGKLQGVKFQQKQEQFYIWKQYSSIHLNNIVTTGVSSKRYNKNT